MLIFVHEWAILLSYKCQHVIINISTICELCQCPIVSWSQLTVFHLPGPRIAVNGFCYVSRSCHASFNVQMHVLQTIILRTAFKKCAGLRIGQVGQNERWDNSVST